MNVNSRGLQWWSRPLIHHCGIAGQRWVTALSPQAGIHEWQEVKALHCLREPCGKCPCFWLSLCAWPWRGVGHVPAAGCPQHCCAWPWQGMRCVPAAGRPHHFGDSHLCWDSGEKQQNLVSISQSETVAQRESFPRVCLPISTANPRSKVFTSLKQIRVWPEQRIAIKTEQMLQDLPFWHLLILSLLLPTHAQGTLPEPMFCCVWLLAANFPG